VKNTVPSGVRQPQLILGKNWRKNGTRDEGETRSRVGKERSQRTECGEALKTPLNLLFLVILFTEVCTI
jgi:hypothetical protein